MKVRALSTGIAVLLVIFATSLALYVTARILPTQKEETQTGDYKISGPYSHENLTIFLVHGKDALGGMKYVTLQEAMQRKIVIVHETKDVNELAIENVSEDQEVYVQSGDIVKGGQQDRVLAMDLIVPPRSGKIPIAAFCVEQGRWRQRGDESAGKFESSNEVLATRDLKLAANKTKSQGEVWAKVSEAQEKIGRNIGGSVKSSASASSLQLSLESKNMQVVADGYIKKLSGIIEGKPDVIGYAFAVNGKINSSDVYGSNALFKQLWPKLLKASAVEAIAELQTNAQFEPVPVERVRGFFTEAEDGKASENAVTDRIKIVTRETDKNILFETRDAKQKERWIHRSYVMK